MLTKELLQAVQNHELSVEQDFRKLFFHKEKRLHNSVKFSVHYMNATKLLWQRE